MNDSFQFVALPSELFEPWFGKSDEELRAAGARRVVADSRPGYPCRVSLAESPVRGRGAIRAMFASGFAAAEMTCIVENLFEDGQWAMLEWRDPLGLRGCGFFHVLGGRIVFQRGYWDKLTFLRQQGLALPGPE